MKRIGGNVDAVFQVRTVTADEIGEQVESWVDVKRVKGFLDYTGGQNSIKAYGTKLEETTHVFICDYAALDVDARNSRMVIKGKVYEVLEIDNPMEMNYHIEIQLKYLGVA